jgi:hypothetical protein
MTHASRNQPRVRGRFAPDPSKPPKKPSPPRQVQNLAALRTMAMRLCLMLEALTPELERRKKRGRARLAALDPAEAARPMPVEIERLLGKAGGVIDAFATLAQVVVRIVEQERQNVPQPARNLKQNEEPLGVRITAELDRLAARRRAAGFPGPNDPK